MDKIDKGLVCFSLFLLPTRTQKSKQNNFTFELAFKKLKKWVIVK
jgi:hypothetical protein